MNTCNTFIPLLLSVIIIIALAISKRVTAIPSVNKQLTQRHIGVRTWLTNQTQLSGGKENDEEKNELKYQSQHLANIQKELLHCLSSFNPFDRAKIEEVRIVENEQKERIQKAAEDREREQKVI